VRIRLGKKSKKSKVLKAQKSWPNFASAVADLAARKSNKGPLPHELWPTQKRDLSEPVKQFLDDLDKRLSLAEKLYLKEKEGRWPDYPNAIQKLARERGLVVPWQTLPPPRDFWEPYRAPAPPEPVPAELASQRLREFTFLELNARERAALRVSYLDPLSWARLKREYFHRNPEELLKPRPK
jgi:hypothetical protein